MRARLNMNAQPAHCTRHNRRGLRVSAGRDDSGSELARGLLEEGPRLGDGSLDGTVRECVGAEIGGLGAPNALAGDAVAAVLVFETGAGC